MNKDILLQGNGEPWLTDENKTVPKKCPVCGADMGLFIMGEPVFLCKGKDKHYYGTLKFTAESDEQEEIDDYRDRLDELEREEYYESKYGKEQE